MRPEEWNCGEKGILMDLLVPFGGLERVVEELNAKVFKSAKPFTVADLMRERLGGDDV
ncbi:toxin-activating lysine-acyltransferase [Pseudodesulfovibrio sp. zrk46]|uniref:toxin-activating lysine-acyltransferase n=1 Tax=Pseudodesulfovibrio sp. zrk46 TaxID=2725288 RepID=UPI001449DCA7|nr:toxin-activating lysine-acyltransferase [Pseudodesulfovibrio sp. zrk46]QJB56968.1 toxin-activating lysine-acyltransferase [Pseudodesulfovibrio sp. zrk46]